MVSRQTKPMNTPTTPTITPEAREAADNERYNAMPVTREPYARGHFVQLLLDKQRGEFFNNEHEIKKLCGKSVMSYPAINAVMELVNERNTLTTRLSDLERIAEGLNKMAIPIPKTICTCKCCIETHKIKAAYQLYLTTHTKK